MRMCLGIAPALLLLVATATPALAWGSKGHEWTVSNAITLLPESKLKQYLREHEGRIRFNSLIPDFHWKDGSVSKLESVDHYIDLEIIAVPPTPADLPLTRMDAARLYNARGVKFSDGGFLPWRIQETYLALVNALKTDRDAVPFWAGVLSHYVADATQPLHTTIHFDGWVSEANGPKELQGIHLDYELTFIEDQGLEFRHSALAAAAPPALIPDVHQATAELVCESWRYVGLIYDVARRHQGPDKYVVWERQLGAMTRQRLGRAASFLASLWLTAWHEAGEPDLSLPPGNAIRPPAG